MKLFDRFKNVFKRRSDDMTDQTDYKKEIDKIFDPELRLRQEECYIWYLGNSDKLVEFYLKTNPQRQTSLNKLNSKDYFWAIAASEVDVKRTHTPLPGTVIKALVRILGIPTISIHNENKEEDIKSEERLRKILKENKFFTTFKRKQVPLMLAIGDGVYTVTYNKNISDKPIIEFIDGRNCAFEWFGDICTAVYIRKYYTYEKKNYMLIEKRSVQNIEGKKKSVIQYSLYELDESLKPKYKVALKTIPDTANLTDLYFEHIDRLLAVPCIFEFDPETERGESIFADRLDLADDLDQNLSQGSNTVRLSTPVEYYPGELLDRTPDGRPKPPKRYDRRFVEVPSDLDAVGENNNKIITTQPQLYFDKYNENALEIIHNFLAGIMSPATLGIDLARKDNALAQREKEKVTMYTRDDLVDCETEILQELFNLVLKIDDYIKAPNSPVGDYENISISFPEYASPTFDDKLATLSPVFASGGISPERYVDELWGDSLSEDEKEHEIAYLMSQRPNMSDNDFGHEEDLIDFGMNEIVEEENQQEE